MDPASPDDVCWVCLDTGDDLVRPCKCPRAAHPKCLARWQLQSAGRNEEKKCRFCNTDLPDWRPVLTPKHLDKPATPVVSVFYNGTHHRIEVQPGAEGFEQFRQELHKITGMPMLDCMQITFQCKSPDTAQDLSFKGISAFDAAIHCASVSAAERQRTRCIKTRRVEGSNSFNSSIEGSSSPGGSSASTPGSGSGSDSWSGSGIESRPGHLKGIKEFFKKIFSGIP